MDVVVARLEEGVGLHVDLDEGIARGLALGAGMPWPLSRRVVPFIVPFRHIDVERAAVGQVDPLLPPRAATRNGTLSV